MKMNEYIELYERHKYEGNNTIDALILTLNSLKQSRESWGQDNKLAKYLGFGLRNAKHPFFQPKVTQKNLQVIETVIEKLNALKESPDYQQEGETSTTRLDILGILGERFNELSKNGKTRELFNYVMFHEGSIDFSMRESTLVEPSPLEILTGNGEPYEDEQTWEPPYIHQLLDSKGIPHTIFDSLENNDLNLENDLGNHVKWAYDNIYRHSYPDSHQESTIARFHHGIQHVTRAANYAPVFANLYRRHGNEEAQNLTATDIKLIQIALLFHDSAREGDDEDLWDHESAIFLYYYLTRVLHIDAETAKFVAEATANKDPSPENGYFQLIEDEYGQLFWQFAKYEEGHFPAKNIYQKIIHDCDCLDIIRARNQYDATYLDFYKEIASKNNLALEEMAELVIEARGLIYSQGDSYITKKEEIKTGYENEEAHARIIRDMQSEAYPILSTLYGKLLSVEELQAITLVNLTPFDETAGMAGENLAAALREGRILARGITTPSAMPTLRPNKPTLTDETLAEREMRKSMRSDNINIKSRKEAPNLKYKNPLRSTSILGYGSGVYPAAGMLIFNPDIGQIKRISAEDFDSGRGQKNHLAHLQEKEYKESREILERELDDLHHKMKLGLFGKKTQLGSNYVELLYDINKYDAIFFTNDPTIGNEIAYNDFNPAHPLSPLLQAIYLQKQYARQYEETRKAYYERYGQERGETLFLERFGPNQFLPIYEYSGLRNKLTPCDTEKLTDENIVNMWVEMCSDFMRNALSHMGRDNSYDFYDELIYNMSIEDIKVLSMYKTKGNILAKVNQPADLSYNVELREKITDAIAKAKEKIITEYEEAVFKRLQDNQLSPFSEEAFLALEYSPHLRDLCSDKIKDDLLRFIYSPDGVISYKLSDIASTSLREKTTTLDIQHCSTKERNFLCKNQFLQAFILCQQLGLEVEIQFLRNKVNELAIQVINDQSAFITGRNYELQSDLHQMINLNNIMTLIDKDNHLRDNIESILLEIVSKLIDTYTNERLNLYDSYMLLKTLQDAGIPDVKLKHYFRPVLNKANETLHERKPHEWNHYCAIAKLVGDEAKPYIYSWLNDYDKPFYSEINSMLDTFKSAGIVFDDENLDVFKSLLEKIHYNDAAFNYVRLSYWLRVMNNLQSLAPESHYSESQLEILKNQFDRVIEKLIKTTKSEYEHASYYSQEQKCYRQLTSFAEEINTILASDFCLPVPDSLITEFNLTLIAFSEMDLSQTKVDESKFHLLKQLHNKLPNPEKREHAMEKLTECMDSKKQVEKDQKQNISAAGL
ncbi:TPA: lpg2239 family Dot/Icm T4SS effector [Legionella pneumophila]|nr:lpg2239 family Dot/Icm T4SS effector [Legionella pneumophila]